MSAKPNRPIILRRVTVTTAVPHHGGAWKVAYADFVTAMMAFFLLMWLLNATPERQRHGLADYFNPTVVQTRSGGADSFATTDAATAEAAATPASEEGFDALARDLATKLSGTGAESMQQRNLLRHVVTRMTDEGLVIELSDLLGEPLFYDGTARPTPPTVELAGIISRALKHVRNGISLTGHIHSYPEMLIESPVWKLSSDRAHEVRVLLEASGLPARRVQRVTAFGDRRNRSRNPMDPANNRIELILLR